MLIQHNRQALNAQNRLRVTTGRQAKSSEKLSSGYRINRSADDAAGLQVSEKLRWQIRGLNRASENISDGLSYVQVADGALQEVHAMLQRMNELATQAANDTNTAADRGAIAAEISQLQEATESIFTDTKFNTFHVFTLDETNAPPGSAIQKGILNVIEPANITQQGNLANTVTFTAPSSDWVSTGNTKPTFSLTQNTYDTSVNPPTTNTSQTSTTTPSNQIPALTHNGVTYNLQDDWTSLLNAAMNANPPATTVTSNGITYNRSGTTLTYQNGNDTVTLTFRGSSHGGTTYYTLTGATAKTVDGTNQVSADTTLSYSTYGEGSGASFLEGSTYAAAYIDFSGLGTNYQVADLVDLGFASTCGHGCGCYYSIKFVDNSAGFTNPQTTANGLPFQETGQGGSYLIELDISSVTNGSQIVAAMVDAANRSSGFDGHWEQLAYNVNQPDRVYLYENTISISSGSGSTWEPKARDAAGEKVVDEEELHIQSSSLAYTDILIKKPAMSNHLLGIDDLPVNSFTAAGGSMQAIQDAIAYVSSKRSYLGAMQNRLEHAKVTDDNTAENSQAAESRIRDTDMAKEMTLYSALNILQQAGESILAQANQTPQGVLNLLS